MLAHPTPRRIVSSAVLCALGACADPAERGEVSTIETMDGGYTMALRLAPDPAEAGTPVQVLTDIRDAANDAPITHATLQITPWMPMHDHGIPEDVVVVDLGEGRYEAQFAFSMPGAWEVRLDVDGPSGPDQGIFALEVY